MENNTQTSGIGFLGLLQLVFIVLKLIGVIGWSWIWVLSPVWITLLICIVLPLLLIWMATHTKWEDNK